MTKKPEKRKPRAKRPPPADDLPLANDHGAPIGSDGFTPRQRLDNIKAIREEFKHQVDLGLYVLKSDIEAKLQAEGEIISSDLTGTLPNRIAGRVAACKRRPTQAQVRTIAVNAVAEMIAHWRKGGIAPDEFTA